MLGHLQREGLTLTDPERSRVVIVNTCGFIDAAKEESVGAILREVARKEAGEIDRVVVAGCMVQKYGRDLAAEIPEVDHFIGLDELEKAPAAALGLPSLPRFTDKPLATRLYDDLAPARPDAPQGLRVPEGRRGVQQPLHVLHDPADARPHALADDRVAREGGAGASRRRASRSSSSSRRTRRATARTSASAAPASRGSSRPPAETGFPWIRFLYAYPKTLHPGVFELMAKETRFVPYVDMPLQHVSRKILASMKRGGDAASYLRQFEEIRKIVPEIALRSTFIVGFPGEKEKIS